MTLKALDPLLHPVEKDLLYTQSRFVDRFFDLIDRDIDPPYAVSLDGLWGSGKTTVMKMLEKKLRDSGYPVFWFNPWEYRKSENVVLAFLQCLAAEHEGRLAEMKISGGVVLRALVETGLEEGLKYITKGMVSYKGVTDKLKQGHEIQAEHRKYRDAIKTIKLEFVELMGRIGEKNGGKPMVIFFDDLDRCLPEDAVQLLEALKNLFVTDNCNSIFICGIDTRIAKKFIDSHYKEIGESFAISYFRKIFNYTISMPYAKSIPELLKDHIRTLFDWDDPDGAKAERLAKLIYTRCLQARVHSIRSYLNILVNFYGFMRFNPEYEFEPENPLVLNLLVLKEAWQPIYEDLIQESFRERCNLHLLVGHYIRRSEEEGKALSYPQKKYLLDFIGDKDAVFANWYLEDLLISYSALA